MARTLVIGLGNPYVSDDAVGIVVARRLAAELPARPGLDFTEAQVGGLRLMDVMQGYDRAVIVDAMLTGAAPGTLRDFTLDDLLATKNTVSSHDGDLKSALEAGRLAGLALPREVRIVGVEAVDVVTFAERLSPAVARAVPAAAARVQALLEEGAA